jgi:outer membrane protein
LSAVAFAGWLPVSALAQAPATAPATLTLDQALAIAKRNNPAYLQVQNARVRSAAQRRTAYGALIPSVNSSFGIDFREGRQQVIAGQLFGSAADQLSSSGALSASMTISPGLGFGLRAVSAQLNAADQDVELNLLSIRRDVTVQFMNALQARARVGLQDSLLASAKTQLELAQARAKAGLATELDTRRSQVSVGQAEVALLQARSQADVELFRLFQQMGVAQQSNVQLSSDLPIALPTGDLNALLDKAMRSSPDLQARRARVNAAGQEYRARQATYLPSLTLSASVAGQTTQRQGAFPAGQPNTDVGSFPIGLTRQPYGIGAQFSLPIFNGFQREQQVQVAATNRKDAEYALRAGELAVQTTVVSQYTILQADFKAVEINRANVQAAREALTLAEDRFRLGLANLVDLVQVRADLERASNDYITSVYTFHRDFVQLEAVTGPLR